MKRIPDILFVICTTLFLIHQYLQKYLGIGVKVADSYLDPLLAMPILLHLVNLERKWITKKKPLSDGEMWGYCLLVAMIAEVIFPLITPNFTYDLLDIVLYLTGTIIYLFTVKLNRGTII